MGVWAVVLGHLLAVDQARHEAAKKHKHQGVQKQTQVAGDATAVGDPRAEQAAGQLEGLGVPSHEEVVVQNSEFFVKTNLITLYNHML